MKDLRKMFLNHVQKYKDIYLEALFVRMNTCIKHSFYTI